MMELWTSLQVSILHPRHHSSWTGTLPPFLLSYFLEGSSSMMSLCTVSEISSLKVSSYYSSSWILYWTVVTCSSEQVSSFFACRWLYAIFPTSQMHLHGWKHFIRHIHNGKFLCINIWLCNYFSQYDIHPYLTKNFKMPSISTITSLKLCTNPICQQRGFILDK